VAENTVHNTILAQINDGSNVSSGAGQRVHLSAADDLLAPFDSSAFSNVGQKIVDRIPPLTNIIAIALAGSGSRAGGSGCDQ
jgi:hypothetical protein